MKRGIKMEKKYTDEQLLDAIRKHPNTGSREWRTKHIKPSVRAIAKRFGGWKAARKRAGVVEVKKQPESKKQSEKAK